MKKRYLILSAVVVLLGWVLVTARSRDIPLNPDVKADKIVIEKTEHALKLYQGDTLLKTYEIALGYGGLEPKTKQGDGRTPEGHYHIAGRNPHSKFHLSLRISYPTQDQAKAAKKRGEDPGDNIMIHGLPNGMGALGKWHQKIDWTAGCIAVTNEEIEEIAKAVSDGTLVEIRH